MEPDWLVCFAVPEEATPFRDRLGSEPGVRVGVSGIGRRNAEQFIRAALASHKPKVVLTSGFAGGLSPKLRTGDVMFEADEGSALEAALRAAGAAPGRFLCAERIAATAAEKQALRQSTGADAVEMESGVIRAICREHGLASATVRVISDAADEDLPLDFNELMTAGQRMNYFKLAWRLARSPTKVGALLRFRRRITHAADRLVAVLLNVIDARAPVRS